MFHYPRSKKMFLPLPVERQRRNWVKKICVRCYKGTKIKAFRLLWASALPNKAQTWPDRRVRLDFEAIADLGRKFNLV